MLKPSQIRGLDMDWAPKAKVQPVTACLIVPLRQLILYLGS